MRQLTVNTPALDEIAYVTDGLVTCSSWGEGLYEFGEEAAIGRTSDGQTAVMLSYMSPSSGGGRALALSQGAYRALVSLKYFVDVIAEPEMQMGLATRDGRSVITIGTTPDGTPERPAFAYCCQRDGALIEGESRDAYFSEPVCRRRQHR